jgi:hypothetical protein
MSKGMGANVSIQNKCKRGKAIEGGQKKFYNFLSLASEMRALPVTYFIPKLLRPPSSVSLSKNGRSFDGNWQCRFAIREYVEGIPARKS